MTPGGGGVIGPPVGRFGGVDRDGEVDGGFAGEGADDGVGDGEGGTKSVGAGFEGIDDGESWGSGLVFVQPTSAVTSTANTAESTRTRGLPGSGGSASLTIAQERHIHSNHESFVTIYGITAGQRRCTSLGI
jgi:hypothetical protein